MYCERISANHDILPEFSKHFQEAHLISSIHKSTHPAKYARCLFKLSEALHQVPGKASEADQHLREALDLYFQITGNPRVSAVKEEDIDALIHISQR
jgi:hypothetical protein